MVGYFRSEAQVQILTKGDEHEKNIANCLKMELFSSVNALMIAFSTLLLRIRV